MEEKSRRHASLLRILGSKDLQSQDAVVNEMTILGFDVTQSSISRDFKELGVIKVGGTYRPAKFMKMPESQSPFQRLIRSVDTAGNNLVVIKTSSGAASAVAEQIDLDVVSGVVGTVAGDNTIFVATKSKAAQAKVIDKVRTL